MMRLLKKWTDRSIHSQVCTRSQELTEGDSVVFPFFQQLSKRLKLNCYNGNSYAYPYVRSREEDYLVAATRLLRRSGARDRRGEDRLEHVRSPHLCAEGNRPQPPRGLRSGACFLHDPDCLES